MKEATGELNMTLVTVLAVAAILLFVLTFVPNLLENISDTWGDMDKDPSTMVPK